MRDAGPGPGEQRDFVRVELDAMGVPDAIPYPTQRLGVFAGPATEGVERPGHVLRVLRQMSMESHALVLGQRRRVAHEPAGNRERRAGGNADPDHRALGRVVEGVDEPDAVVDDVRLALDEAVGRQAAVALADAHRPARRVEPQAHRGGRFDGVLQPHPVGVEIEMVRARPAAGKRQLREAELRGDEHVLGPHPRPDRIKRLQPAEQERVLARRYRAGQGLEKVVMRIDQRGRRHAAAGVDYFPAGRIAGIATADRRYPPLFDENVRAGELGPFSVHRDDRIGVPDPELPGRQRTAPLRRRGTEVWPETGVISEEELARPGRFELPTS